VKIVGIYPQISAQELVRIACSQAQHSGGIEGIEGLCEEGRFAALESERTVSRWVCTGML